VKCWRSGDGGGFPSLAAPLKDRIGECRWGIAAEGEPRTESQPAPTSIYSTVFRGPTNHVGLGAPDQDARARPKRPLGLTGGRSNLTLSPLISHHFLRSLISYSKLSFISFSFLSYFITD
jgi:hypothetical protein